jgi:ABC-type multidrug transport system fused ATPase/permease subunit
MIRTLKNFYKFVFVYKYHFWISIFFIAIAGLLKNFIPIELGKIVDQANSGGIVNSFDVLIWLIILVVARILLVPLGRQFSDYLIIKVKQDIWAAVFKHIHELDFAYHVNKSSGSLISLFKRGDNGAISFYINLNILGIEILIEFLFLLIFLASIYPKILVVSIIIFVLMVAFMFFSLKQNVTKRSIANYYADVVSGITVDNMINFDTVKYFANEKYEQERLEKWLEKSRKAEMEYINTFRIIELGNGGIINIGMLAMILVALLDFSNGIITVGQFVMVTTFATFFAPRLYDLVFNMREVAKNFVDLEKYMAVLDENIKIKDKSKKQVSEFWNSLLHTSPFSVEFKNIVFSYDKGRDTVKNFNLKIQPGESIALVGQSGAGKTTMVKLLMRLYDPLEGQILINGVDIKDISKADLRKRIGIVPQETILFNDTIGYNIAYGQSEFTAEQLDEAAKAAHLYDFIMSLPDKYMTFVGERGIKLSGGQKQRLGIARVFMENAPIIVFDEATSNLDSESERLIQKAFWEMAKGKTTIIIAHRLSTVKKADKIVVMENGNIVEIGTHKELSQKSSGIYKYLWKLQTTDEIN